MSESAATLLLGTAVSIAFLHTLIGVDHYLPFALVGKARGWNLGRTLRLTALCGLGHVVGSVLLGVVGIGLGVALNKLEWIESVRGSVAAWSLIAFGLMYAAWSFVAVARGKTHEHAHVHADGTIHTHEHSHDDSHAHAHEEQASIPSWSLFVIFVFGPCEALIPLLMVPAFEFNWGLVALVTLVFSLVTVVTMLAGVTAVFSGLGVLPGKGLAKYSNALAGLAIAGSGLSIQILGI